MRPRGGARSWRGEELAAREMSRDLPSSAEVSPRGLAGFAAGSEAEISRGSRGAAEPGDHVEVTLDDVCAALFPCGSIIRPSTSYG